jgi:uncharacterized YigZ family protein
MRTLSAPHEHETEIKRSRFIARVARADSPEDALAFLESVRDPAATHNCWAYRVGDAYRFSDDGEPGGTAGRPILSAIEGQGLDHVMVVVTRFFGGTKLGAGGLVRAYGGTAASCLRAAPQTEVVARVTLVLGAPYEVTGAVYGLLESHDARKLDETHGADGLILTLSVPVDAREGFATALSDATRGRARLEEPG